MRHALVYRIELRHRLNWRLSVFGLKPRGRQAPIASCRSKPVRHDTRQKKTRHESLVVQVSRDLFPGCPGAANKARLRSYPPKTLTANWATPNETCLFSVLYLAQRRELVTRFMTVMWQVSKQNHQCTGTIPEQVRYGFSLHGEADMNASGLTCVAPTLILPDLASKA